jgi:hypothetical protein
MRALLAYDKYSDFLGDIESDEELDVMGAEAFLNTHKDFPQTEYNGLIMVAWCRSRGIPTTNKNLSLAFKDLQGSGFLEPAPRSAPRASGTGIFIVGFSDENGDALRKLADDPSLSDTTRKKRFEALKKLAVAQRISMRNAR